MNKLKPKIIAFLFSLVVTFTLSFVMSFFVDLSNALQHVAFGFFFTVGIVAALSFISYLCGVNARFEEVYKNE